MVKKPIPTQNLLDLLVSRLDLSVESVLENASEQPRLFQKAIDYRIDQMHKRNEAKMHLDHKKAERELRFRKDARESGEKVTEGTIDAMLLTDKTVIEAIRGFSAAEESEEYSRLLLEAYRMRRDSLQTIASIAGRDISMERAMETATAKLNDAKVKLHNKFPGGEEEES